MIQAYIPSSMELHKHNAGKFIENPEMLPDGTEVAIREIGTEMSNENGSWWERGFIYSKSDGKKYISTIDAWYDISEQEWEVYEYV